MIDSHDYFWQVQCILNLNMMTQDCLYGNNEVDHTEGFHCFLILPLGAPESATLSYVNLLCRHFFELLLQIHCAPLLHLYVTCIQLEYLNNLTGTHLLYYIFYYVYIEYLSCSGVIVTDGGKGYATHGTFQIKV